MEGEGSFFVNKSNYYTLTFSIGQATTDLALMVAIKTFLNNLPGKYSIKRNYEGVVSLTNAKSKSNSKDAVIISISNVDYIKNSLVPFFDSLV
ncbi:hypothetical protein GCM10023339_73990 [Alloalcanivorax gelatiniphagus]